MNWPFVLFDVNCADDLVYFKHQDYTLLPSLMTATALNNIDGRLLPVNPAKTGGRGYHAYDTMRIVLSSEIASIKYMLGGCQWYGNTQPRDDVGLVVRSFPCRILYSTTRAFARMASYYDHMDMHDSISACSVNILDHSNKIATTVH